MFYLNTIEQLFLFVEQLFHLEVCLPYSRLLAGIPILAVFQNLRWNSNKTPLSATHSMISHFFWFLPNTFRGRTELRAWASINVFQHFCRLGPTCKDNLEKVEWIVKVAKNDQLLLFNGQAVQLTKNFFLPTGWK